MILGISGPLASGKSHLAQILAGSLVPILELDDVGKSYFFRPDIQRKLKQNLGTTHREKIAKKVFLEFPEMLSVLEGILHPLMRRKMVQILRKFALWPRQKKILFYGNSSLHFDFSKIFPKNRLRYIVVAALPGAFHFPEVCDAMIHLRIGKTEAFARAQKRGISSGVFQGIWQRQQEDHLSFQKNFEKIATDTFSLLNK